MLEYASDLFDEATVAALGAAAGAAAGGRGGGRRPRARQSIDILEPAERDTILRVWNDTARCAAGSRCRAIAAGELIALPRDAAGAVCRAGARTPDAIAVVFEDRTLTYAALDAHANRLAHHLQSLGVGPETIVGLCVERSPEMVIGLLGILKAGGAYLPLDPNYPRERLAFMLADAGAAVLVTQQRCSDGCRKTLQPAPGAAAPSCGSTPTGPPSRGSPTTAPDTALDPRHPAYVIYTSGSTGTPKGVVVEHRKSGQQVEHCAIAFYAD